MINEQLLERIVLKLKVLAEKPVIIGTRLSVEYILNLLTYGTNIGEILEEYEGLRPEDIHACILFACKSIANTTLISVV
ncbi:MAG: DUF433 domain-containing protein [Rhizonema sp. NSF051]|nr:DUF433 domain-containing protein [Rhizonema sp. NSF051]